MMAEYALTATDHIVIRTADGACIPDDPDNRDRVEYEEWLADGGVPDPYVPPEQELEKVAGPPPEIAVVYTQENRLRALEGKQPIKIEEFMATIQMLKG